MLAPNSSVEITARSIDLGRKIIALRQVTSVTVGEQRPLLLIGLAMLIGGLILGGHAVLVGGAEPFAGRRGGSLELWIAFGMMGLGVASFLHARRLLVIATSDGAKTRIAAASDEALEIVASHIRAALNAEPGEHLDIVVDLSATGQRPQKSSLQSMSERNGYPRSDIRPYTPMASEPAASPFNTFTIANEGMTPATSKAPPADLSAALMPAIDRPALPDRGLLKAVEALFRRLEQNDVPHSQALIGLLSVVERHLSGEGVDRDEAVEHWQGFRDYVDQYLGDVPGLKDLTAAVDRQFITETAAT